MNRTIKRRILACTSDGPIYYDEITYMEAINGLFMGTYEQWVRLGGKRAPKLGDCKLESHK